MHYLPPHTKGTAMLSLIRFECKKVVSSRFFLSLLALICLFVMGFYTFLYIQTDRPEELAVFTEAILFQHEETITELNRQVDDGEIEVNSFAYETELAQYTRLKKQAEVELRAFEEEEWIPLLEQEAASMQQMIDMQQERNYQSRTYMSAFTEDTHVAYLNQLIETGAYPVLPINNFSPMTIYDQVFSDPLIEDTVRSMSTKYSSSGVHTLYHLYEISFSIFGAGLFLFMFGDMFTKERAKSQGQMSLMRTQPVTHRAVTTAKVLTMLGLSLFILLGLSAIFYVVGAIIDQPGDFSYPILVYGSDYAFTLISMASFLAQSLTLFLLYLLFLFVLVQLISSFTEIGIIAISLTLLTTIGLYFLIEPTWSIAPFLPFHYFHVSDIVTGTYAALHSQPLFSPITGVVVLVVWSAVVSMITAVIRNRGGAA
ncbi:hypothetical protein FLK61_24365 [Paenalkalicoccus suaedae]|uniref:ABC transporter permease n=1 Tax=Paenalkalicoccus suaedae TaxID=2592382 RepID=A0A859F9V1_9BACI|nr:hypothetical protein [Paenalkalicoccus suaedae]QKS69919.1 hypothetical protein FLK61_24365 [Paenalkalicoccus suaedae]